MNSQTTSRFRKLARALPASIRRQASRAYKIWLGDPWHPSLHFKKIHQTEPIYSVRVGRDWRAVGAKHGDLMVWFWIGSHAEYDRVIKRLRQV